MRRAPFSFTSSLTGFVAQLEETGPLRWRHHAASLGLFHLGDQWATKEESCSPGFGMQLLCFSVSASSTKNFVIRNNSRIYFSKIN